MFMDSVDSSTTIRVYLWCYLRNSEISKMDLVYLKIEIMKEERLKIPSGYEFVRIENNEVILKEINPKFPESWEDVDEFYYEPKQIEDAAESLVTLWQLKAEYRKIEGGTIDWEDCDQLKHCINFLRKTIKKDSYYTNCEFFAFLTVEARDHFFTHHRDLIEKARPLMVGE